MPKAQTKKRNLPPPPPTEEIIDFDALWKDFISDFSEETTQATLPDLWADVDWSIPPVFLEQEMINMLRTKFKSKDKRKNSDKLVKLVLKSGEIHYVLFHIEVQKALELLFGRRMFDYKILSMMRYKTEDFTALAIFIGDAPSEKHLKYEHEKYGTKTVYQYNNYVVANQIEEKLAASNNVFELAVLAVKYTLDTVGDDVRRFAFKRKIFQLADEKQIPREKIHRFLTFVGEYMHLKPELEELFQEETSYYEQFKVDDMKRHTTFRTRGMADAYFKVAAGRTIAEEIAAEVAEAVAENTIKVTSEKEAEKEAEKKRTILSMHEKTDFSNEKIADILSVEVDFVAKVIAEAVQKTAILSYQSEGFSATEIAEKMSLDLDTVKAILGIVQPVISENIANENS